MLSNKNNSTNAELGGQYQLVLFKVIKKQRRQHISVAWFIHHVNHPISLNINNSEELKRNILQSQHTRHNHTKMIWPHVLRHLTVVFLTNIKIWQCFELLQQCKISGYTLIYITVQKLWVSEIVLWKITFIHKCCSFELPDHQIILKINVYVI